VSEPSPAPASNGSTEPSGIAVDAAGVEVAGVTKTFDGRSLVLAGVDVAVEAGGALALLGPSGCGKTTLLRIIAGLERPDDGTVTVGDRLLTSSDTFVAPERRRVGMVFQDWALFPHLSVARNVGFGLPRAERKVSPRIDEALELVGLAGMGDRMPSTLSGGQQQRVALARAIAPRPSVLLLDEPFSNLDASLRAHVRTEIHQLLVGLGITTVFVTHDQDEAFVLGDRVAVLAEGRVVQVGPPAELYQRPATRWLAGFVGDANLLSGTAQGDAATTVLGTLPLVSTASGDVDVLVRPEHLELVPGTSAGGEPGGVSATVELVEFVGHDTTYLVRAGDLALQIRRPSMPVVARGEQVHVRYVGGDAAWFPAEERPDR
jgi:iron(III) transport system ATP-binding protein